MLQLYEHDAISSINHVLIHLTSLITVLSSEEEHLRHLTKNVDKEKVLDSSLKACALAISILNTRYDYRIGCDEETKINDYKIFTLLIDLFG